MHVEDDQSNGIRECSGDYLIEQLQMGSSYSKEMELAYKLTAPLTANRIGQGCSPVDTSLIRLKRKHFLYISESSKRCSV